VRITFAVDTVVPLLTESFPSPIDTTGPEPSKHVVVTDILVPRSLVAWLIVGERPPISELVATVQLLITVTVTPRGADAEPAIADRCPDKRAIRATPIHVR